MTVYKKTSLENLYLHQQLDEAREEHYFSEDEIKNIKTHLPVDLYMPNLFIKIGLGILTVFIIIASIGFLYLFLNNSGTANSVFVFSGLLCYAMLEVMTGIKRHYNSGVDNMLMTASVVFIAFGLKDVFDEDSIMAFIIFLMASWVAIRFADLFAAISSMIIFYVFCYLILKKTGIIVLAPVCLIIISTIAYIISKNLYQNTKRLFYKPLYVSLFTTSLFAIYTFGNFYVADKIMGAPQSDISSIIFWLWTWAIPIVFIWKGIASKDTIFLRSGIILMAISILTFRYYHPILPVEIAMLIAGTFLVVINYFLSKYLQYERNGFIYNEHDKKSNKYEDLQGFVLGQAFGQQQDAPKQHTKFGGGSFGGAGGGGNF